MQFNRTKIAQFQTQNCPLTLREAVDEFYALNAHIFTPPAPNTDWTTLLVHHDVGHVFFGVNTSILDEAAGDYWTLLGSDLSLKEYIAYAKSPEGQKLAKAIGWANLLKSMVLSLPLLVKIYIRTRKMNKKWQTRDYAAYMDTPLSEVRKAFNLSILPY